jgi:hypothetical protein
MNRPTQALRPASVLAASALLLAAQAWAGDVTIADVAPRDSIFVMGADDFASAKAAFDRTGFAAIMREDSIREWMQEMSDEAMDELADMLENIDAEIDDLSMPTGPTGLAFWLAPGEDGGEPQPHAIVLGDFGEDADRMHEVFLSAVDKGEEDESLLVERDTLRGVEILSLTEIEDEDAEEDAGGEDEWDEFEDWDEDEGPESFDTMHFARSGNYLMLASSKDRVERTIDRLAGDDLDSIAADDEFRTATARLGKSDGYMVVLTRPMFEMAEAMDEAGAAGGMPLMGLLDSMGLTEIRSFSMGLRLDADSGMAESGGLLRVPEMRGLMSMFDNPATDFTPPAFVDADVSNLAVYQFDIARTFDVVRTVVNALPPEMQGQAAMLPMVEGMMGPLLSNIGPQIYVASRFERPFSPESQKQLMAFKVRDEVALGGFLGEQTRGFGMMGREFQGGQIWTMPEGGNPMMPIPSDIGIGLGYGHLFVGPVPSVEGALRLAGQGEAPRLASDARFKKAASNVKNKGLWFAYSDTRASLEYYDWMMRNFDQVMRAQAEAAIEGVDDPELRASIMESFEDSAPEWMERVPDLGIVAKHVGDTVMEAHRVPDGIEFRSIVLRP